MSKVEIPKGCGVMGDNVCPNCQYFDELKQDEHPHYFEGEGCCTLPQYLGDIVGDFDSCHMWKGKK